MTMEARNGYNESGGKRFQFGLSEHSQCTDLRTETNGIGVRGGLLSYLDK